MMKDWLQKSMQDMEHDETKKKCPDCGSDRVEFDGTEWVCKKCGLVID